MNPETNPLAQQTQPLNAQQVQRLVAGLLGGLVEMAEDVDSVRAAVCWLASADPVAMKLWQAFRQIKAQMEKLRTMAMAQAPKAEDGKKPD